MSSCTRLVLTNTHDPYALCRRSIGAQEPALRRRTGLWGAVGNLSEDGDLWHLQKQPQSLTTTTRGGCAAHPQLRSGAPEWFCPVARCRGRTGPRPEVLEKSRAFGSTGAWRQFLYLTCDTARGQR